MCPFLIILQSCNFQSCNSFFHFWNFFGKTKIDNPNLRLAGVLAAAQEEEELVAIRDDQLTAAPLFFYVNSEKGGSIESLMLPRNALWDNGLHAMSRCN